jgi:hypothetical protein
MPRSIATMTAAVVVRELGRVAARTDSDCFALVVLTVSVKRFSKIME